MPNTYGLNRSLGSAIATIAAVALLSSVAVFAALHQLRTANASQDRSREILTELDNFRSEMLNQETAVRGYLLTSRTSSLEPYYKSRPAFDQAMVRLRELIGPDSAQNKLLDEAEASARDWQANIGETIVRDMANAATRPQAMEIESTGAGKSRFDLFRAKLAEIEAHEKRSLAAQDTLVTRTGHRAILALTIGAFVTLIICAGVAVAINRLITTPLVNLAGVMRRLVQRDMSAQVPSLGQRNEVGDMARAVAVFKDSLIELDRTALLRVTADTLPAMVGYIDAERRVGFLNGEFARWFDLEAADVAEVQGRPLDQVFAVKPLPGAGHLETAFAGEEARFEEPLTLRTGERRDVETYFRPHRAPNGKVLGVVTLLTDVTERKDVDRRLLRQAQDLARSNEELEQFAYVASHDLKAPLRGIENLVSWIEEDLETALTDDTRTNMKLLKSRVHRLESLLDDLLTYSRAGRDDVVAEVIDSKALVEELAELVSPPEGFRITAGSTLPTLVAARAPLTQTLQNLIGNAIKHHDRPHEGHVHIEAGRCGRLIEFIMTDNGPGIPDRFRSRVFGMFQTLKPRDEVEGSGMGLAIVKKLVERQGGAVWLSEGPDGIGLRVHFTWPAKPANPKEK